MPTYRGNGGNSANPREGEHVAGFSHGTDPMGQDCLNVTAVWALSVAPPIADGGPMAHTAARNGRKIARPRGGGGTPRFRAPTTPPTKCWS